MADDVKASFNSGESIAKKILETCGLEPVVYDSKELSIIKVKEKQAAPLINVLVDSANKNQDENKNTNKNEGETSTAVALEGIKKQSKTEDFNRLVAFIESDPDVKEFLKEKPAYGKLKSAGLFLAGLSDASNQGDANAVAGVIADFVDEDAAYQRKRQEVPFSMIGLQNRLLLSSYYGMSYGAVEGTSTVDNQWRAYGPVGLEYKLRASDWGILGFNVAPFDLGAYVTNELNGSDYQAKLKDIRAPSYFVSYSLKNKPVAVLLGHQENLLMGDGQYHDVNFLAFAFDLPLYSLF